MESLGVVPATCNHTVWDIRYSLPILEQSISGLYTAWQTTLKHLTEISSLFLVSLLLVYF